MYQVLKNNKLISWNSFGGNKLCMAVIFSLLLEINRHPNDVSTTICHKFRENIIIFFNVELCKLTSINVIARSACGSYVSDFVMRGTFPNERE